VLKDATGATWSEITTSELFVDAGIEWVRKSSSKGLFKANVKNKSGRDGYKSAIGGW